MKPPVVTELSPTLFQVLGHSVKLQTRRGRLLLLCSCKNHQTFVLENPFCYHKQLVIQHLNTKQAKQKVNELIKEYEGYKRINSVVTCDFFLDDLNKIKELL